MRKSLLLLALIFCHLLLEATEKREDLRCLQLLPHQLYPIAVHFAIPEHFVAMSPNEDDPFLEGVYWGPPGVLEAYFKDPKSLKQPIIRVKFQANATQTELLNTEREELKPLNILWEKECVWGVYPVKSLFAKMLDQTICVAWVGLNAPNDSTTLFELIYPGKMPTKDELRFWYQFLDKTTLLPEKEFCLAYGREYRSGCTDVICNTAEGTAKFKVIAEQRTSDGELHISLQPISDNIEIECKDAYIKRFTEEWHGGKPVVAIRCLVTEHDSEMHSYLFDIATYALIQSVDDFSNSQPSNHIALF